MGGKVSEIVLIAGEWKARALIRAQLSEEGWQVRALRTIEEAILLLGRRLIEPRLIILDTTGQDLRESILADLQTLAGGAPMLLCASAFDMAKLTSDEGGFTDFLVRPFTVGEVISAVREALGDEAMDNEAARQSGDEER
jgi:DNA-binding response OmpR family regulator